MSKIVTTILIFCSIVGAVDKLFGSKLGYGKHFEAGIREMGSFTLSMIGIYCLSPVIAKTLTPILIPLSKLIKADPSIFLGSLLATDLGGYASALELAQSPEMINLSGIILASMLGTVISFVIPMATNFISDQNFIYFSKGCLSGIVTVPIGVFVGGILLEVPMKMLLVNLIPIIFISVFIVLALLKAPDMTIKSFSYLGKGIALLSMIGLILSILNFMLDINILKDMLPFEEGLLLVGKIAIILSGAYSLIAFLSKILRSNLEKISLKLGINEESIMGIFTTLVNAVPMLAIFDKMDWKGQIINGAFVVSSGFVLGGQLAFVSSVSEKVVMPFILSKLIAGITAIIVANILIKSEEKRMEM